MAIHDLQRRIAERGRIRIGVQAATRSGKKAPRKLNAFRFTSGDRAVIDAVTGLYGGATEAWRNGSQDQWETITDARDIPILLPPSEMAFSQFYETWAKGFCTRRCDGRWDTVRDQACDCDPEARECKATTRLSVILPEIPGLGTWRLESHGYYAAVELAAAVELIDRELAAGRLVPARLLLVEREVRRLIAGQAKVHQFVVPMIDVDLTAFAAAGVAGTVEGHPGIQLTASTPALGQGVEAQSRPRGWKPVDTAALPPGPAVSVADQLAEVDPATRPVKKRANAAAPIKPTGRRPRTAAQRAVEGADVDPGDGPRCQNCAGLLAGHAVTRHPQGWVHKSCPDLPPGSGGTGRGGTSAGAAHSQPAGEPAPTATTTTTDGDDSDGDGDDGGVAAMSDLQRRKLHALAAEVFPDHTDTERRTEILDLAEVLGQPGLTSRTQLTAATASELIDTLARIQTGEVEWVGQQLVENEPGPFDHDGVA